VPHHSPVDPSLATVFQALSDPTRLAVVERLSIAPASVTELARPFEMALPSFIQHLGVLARAGIVTSHKTGRTRVFQLAPAALELAAAWLATFRNHWERRLDQLDELLLADERSRPASDPLIPAIDHPEKPTPTETIP
jgi:DNA-binding transcriptional ArsR family regulator